MKPAIVHAERFDAVLRPQLHSIVRTSKLYFALNTSPHIFEAFGGEAYGNMPASSSPVVKPVSLTQHSLSYFLFLRVEICFMV